MQLHSRLSLGKIMAAVLLVTASLLLYFYHLGKTEFYSDPPARIAVYARQMALDNAWLVPTLRNEPRIDIPPLYLWAVKIVSGFSPDLSAFEERLPGAICSLLLILLVAWWVYQHASRYGREDVADVPAEGVALLAGLLIASNPILFDVGREGTLNSMFALLYVAASFCWGGVARSAPLFLRRAALAQLDRLGLSLCRLGDARARAAGDAPALDALFSGHTFLSSAQA